MVQTQYQVLEGYQQAIIYPDLEGLEGSLQVWTYPEWFGHIVKALWILKGSDIN